MANIKKNPSVAANLSYSGFDMSQLVKFTSTTGELLPVYYDILYPGDKITARPSWRTITMPMEGPVMCNLTEHVDWFVVPLDQIYSLFSNQMYNINDIHTSLFDRDSIVSAKRIPYFYGDAFGDIFAALINPSSLPEETFFDKYFNRAYSPIGGRVTLRGTALRLMEHLGLPIGYRESGDGIPAISPILFAAYQKIYFDYYRITDRELADPSAYSLDRFYNIGAVGQVDATELIPFLTLRYRPREKDFFTMNFVSPLYPTRGETSFNGQKSVSDTFQQWLQSVQADTFDASSAEDSSDSPSQLALQPINEEGWPLSPTAIRTAFAVQKLLEVTRRAGKHIDQQTLAHFGVKPSSKVTGEVEFLGGHSAAVDINAVVSTAETEQAALGQMAGKGFGKATGDTIRFENNYPCPVVLMAIYSCDVSIDWKQEGMEPFNYYVDMNRFYMPEFDNLGMQPLFKYMYHFNNDAEDNTFSRWIYRWQESKMKYNRTLGGLARNLDTWSVNSVVFDPTDLSNYLVSPFALDGSLFYPYRFDSAAGASESAPNPEWGPYRGSTLFNSDPLIHEMYFDVKKSSTMSTYGLESI